MPDVTPPDPREAYGRIVHDIRVACEADRAAAEGRQRFNLPPWDGRDDWQRELDMRIGSAVAARAVADAGLVNNRRDAQLFALGTALPAARRALVKAITDATCEAEAKPFRVALQALGGEEQ